MGEKLTLESSWQEHFNSVTQQLNLQIATMNAKIERDQAQLAQCNAQIDEKTATIANLTREKEIEQENSAESGRNEQMWREKLENFKKEKSVELDELNETHEVLKAKSKKLLLSQKQLLTGRN